MPAADVQPLTPDQLAPVVATAEAGWAATGVGGASLAALTGLDVRIADLPGNVLGAQTPGVIWIDINAAGHGWFIDANPADPVPADKVDLLTVVAHELGHALGLAHTATGVMQEALAVGARHPVGCGCPACTAAAKALAPPAAAPALAADLTQVPAAAGAAAGGGPAAPAAAGGPALPAPWGFAWLAGGAGQAVARSGGLTAAAAWGDPWPGAGPGSVWGPAMDTGGPFGDPLADGAAIDQFFAALGNAVDDPGLLWNDSLAHSI
jgi:hypothetical protein